MNITKEDINEKENCQRYTVCIVECGKIGIFFANLFAEAGFNVIGINANPHKLKMLRRGRNPFSSNAEVQSLKRFLKEGSFTASADVRKAASVSNIIIIAVPITIDEKKRPDYSFLKKTCKEIGLGLERGSIVLFVSMTGPGIIEEDARKVLENASGLKAGLDFGLAACPAHLMMPRIDPNRTLVVGGIDESSVKAASIILETITDSTVRKTTSIKTVEALDLFQKASNETNLAFANELALLCEKLKLDYVEILQILSENDTPIPLAIPGISRGSNRRGFYLLLEEAVNANAKFTLMTLVEKINTGIADYTVRLVKDAMKACGKAMRRTKVAVLGVSQSPDVKEVPGELILKTIELLRKRARTLEIYDPIFSRKELDELGLEAQTFSKTIEAADCFVVLVGHHQFERLNLKRISLRAATCPAIVDMAHIIDPAKAEKYGFIYRGIGRGIWKK